jgi:16S rRNA (adenine1518-N6/adenine1519-N6)-dimethyltransferase
MTQYPKLNPRKSLGQHFLTDRNIIRKIVDSISAGSSHRIIELGAGTGALTEALTNRFDDIQAIELDRRAVHILNERFSDLSVQHKDMLNLDWEKLSLGKQKTHVAGNLPYHITSPILFDLLANRHLFSEATLMMQKEVAERLTAAIRTKEYGILSVQVQLMSLPEILFLVPPGCFTPPPKVESAVIRLKFEKKPLRCSDKHLKTVVRAAFNQRRKKLRNALSGVIPKKQQPDSFNFDKRAEAWLPREYEKLTAYLEDVGILT